MNKKNSEAVTKIVIFSGSFLILLFSGIYLFLIMRLVSRVAPRLSDIYYERYQESGQRSYLLESAVILPTGDNLAHLNYLLLEEGEYRLAEIINSIARDQRFNQKAAEAALFNLNLNQADKYLALTSEGRVKGELVAFRSSLLGQGAELIENPSTDAGKLLKMVENKDFTLYEIDKKIGEDIELINRTKPYRAENILSQAENLHLNGFYYLALNTMIKDPGRCTRDFYLLKGKIYSEGENFREALKIIEDGLVCNPADQALLSKAVEYSNYLGEAAKAAFFAQRLNYLSGLMR